MSNFSAIQAVPFCILDLDELGYSIYDLDRCGVQQWLRGINEYYATAPCHFYDSFTADDFVGTQWPIGLTYQQLVWFYWKPKSIAWDGFYSVCDLSSCETPETGYTEIPYITYENTLRRVNAISNTCDQDYGTKGDLWPGIHVTRHPFGGCDTGSTIGYSTGTWNPTFCMYTLVNFLFTARAFFPALGLLSDEEFGIPALSAHTGGHMPRIVKKNSLYWPTFEFSFGNECNVGSGTSTGGTTFDLPAHGHKDTMCTYECCEGFPCPPNIAKPCGCLLYPSSTGFSGNLVIDGDSVAVPLHASGSDAVIEDGCPTSTPPCPVQGVIGCGGSCATFDSEFFDMTFVE